MLINQEKSYLIVACDNLSEWPEDRALVSLNSENVAKFLFENVVC